MLNFRQHCSELRVKLNICWHLLRTPSVLLRDSWLWPVAHTSHHVLYSSIAIFNGRNFSRSPWNFVGPLIAFWILSLSQKRPYLDLYSPILWIYFFQHIPQTHSHIKLHDDSWWRMMKQSCFLNVINIFIGFQWCTKMTCGSWFSSFLGLFGLVRVVSPLWKTFSFLCYVFYWSSDIQQWRPPQSSL